MSNNVILAKSFNAGGALVANSIAKAGSNDYDVVQAAAATDSLVGVTTEVASASAERVDVIMIGVADLKIGATVTRGALLMSDSSGYGITAAASAGSNVRTIGIALMSGASGDIIPCYVCPGSFQG